MNHFKCMTQRLDIRVRSEILRPISHNLSREKHLRIRLICDLNVGKRLVVLQVDIILGGVLLDEVSLSQ